MSMEFLLWSYLDLQWLRRNVGGWGEYNLRVPENVVRVLQEQDFLKRPAQERRLIIPC